MSIKRSSRSEVENFRALDNLRAVNALVSEGHDIIRLEAGQPCFGAPGPALDYAAAVLKSDPVQGYTDAQGTVKLRQRIAQHYRDFYGCDVDPSRIALTAGSSPGFVLALLAAFDAGDTIALTTPTYAAYRNILKSLNLNVLEIPTDADTNFQPTADLLSACGQRFDGLIITSPSNPTGTMIDAAELQKICAWCQSRNIRLISDEAYHGISYEARAHSAAQYSSSAIVLNTFSKYFAMTGWRLGWVVVPDDLKDAVKKLAENLLVAPPTLSQHVAWKVFDHLDILDSYVDLYRANRDILMAGLPEAGLTKLSAAQGALYIYADISDLSHNSEEFCRRMLHEAGVSTTAGIDFDPARGHSTLRLSYAGTSAHMKEACRRLKHWLA